MVTATRERTKRNSSRTSKKSRRDAFITQNIGLVRHVLERTTRNLPRHVDRDDLYEAGMIGLLEAADRFDPSRQVRFSTYAVTRIRGAILDAMRAEDWLSRSLRSEVSAMDEAHAELEQEYGRPPSGEELCKHLDVASKKLNKLAQASGSCIFQSFDSHGEGTSLESVEQAPASESQADSPLDLAILSEDKERLAEAIGALPENERIVINLYYFEQLLLRDISQVLGVSDSRICQIHHAALRRLKNMMAECTEGELLAAATS